MPISKAGCPGMTANKLIFGITGASGSGKSFAADIFRQRGVRVLDADLIAHGVTAPGSNACAEILAHFGGEVFDSDGVLLRKKLAAKVFSDPKELGILNAITHKYIKKEIIMRLAASRARASAVDGAVIIGSPIEPMCSFLVGVCAPEAVRIKRITARDGITNDEALLRIKAQPTEEFYRAHCRYIIENDGEHSVADAVEQIIRTEGIL